MGGVHKQIFRSHRSPCFKDITSIYLSNFAGAHHQNFNCSKLTSLPGSAPASNPGPFFACILASYTQALPPCVTRHSIMSVFSAVRLGLALMLLSIDSSEAINWPKVVSN